MIFPKVIFVITRQFLFTMEDNSTQGCRLEGGVILHKNFETGIVPSRKIVLFYNLQCNMTSCITMSRYISFKLYVKFPQLSSYGN